MDPFVFYNLGSMFFDQGQSAEAEDYYRRATERDPSFADAYMQLGLSMIQQGKMAEATPHLEKVLELAPGSENAALAQEFLALVQG
jgi:Tfp pilus assembly protein PilF